MNKLIIVIVMCVIPLTTFSQTNLGQMFEKAEKGDIEAQYKLGQYYFSKKDYKQATFWLQKSAIKSNQAKILLGEMYEYGIIKDLEGKKKAFDLYNQAATAGDGSGLYKLAFCYFHGIGVVRDEKKGLENLKQAVSEDYVDAVFDYGIALEKGMYGVSQDLETSFKFIYTAAVEGNKRAIDRMLKYEQDDNINVTALKLCLADVMFRGLQDFERAEILYKEAFNLGAIEAAAGLGYMYLVIDNTDSEWAFNLLGYGEMSVDHDKRIKFRTNKQFTDIDNASYWLEKALEKGITQINICGFERDCPISLHYCLYILYSHSSSSIICSPLDYKKAYNNLKIYAESYNDYMIEEPKLSMADLQYLGGFDWEKAFSTYIYFANNDDTFADWGYSGAALCYYYGRGVKRDYGLAVEYAKKAIELGKDSDAMNLLSKCYRYGRGVGMDNVKAEYWFKQALENHSEAAMRLQKQRETVDLNN